MTFTVSDNGRLCNQIIRNICVSLVSEQHSLQVSYSSYDRIKRLGIPLYSGSNAYDSYIPLTDENFFLLLNSGFLPYNVYANSHYFQTKDISNYIYTWFKREGVRTSVMSSNPFNHRYKVNNDCFVHVRLNDVAERNPGFAYYKKAIDSLFYDTLYIGTDEPTHPLIKQLSEQYPGLSVVAYDEVETIQFASTNKHVILSHGSYSTVIGYLSFFSDVYYPMYQPEIQWYGDTFSVPEWNRIEFT